MEQAGRKVLRCFFAGLASTMIWMGCQVDDGVNMWGSPRLLLFIYCPVIFGASVKSRQELVLLILLLCSSGLVAGCGSDTNRPSRGEPVGECTPEPRGERPSAEEPNVANRENEYVINLEEWEISKDGTEAERTTDGINAAIAWASENGYGTVRLPAGNYLVGKPVNDAYTGGVVLPSNIIFALDDEAVIQMAPNKTWNYCVVEIANQTDVVITGGTIRGEREEHDFGSGGAHDEGHTVCVWEGSERVLIEGVHLTQATGDGVLIVGGADGVSSRDITIRGNEISHNRRQGVSIVGGINVVIEDNEIHHISGTSPQFGVDIESLHYSSRDILIRRNHFHQNQGGDYVNTDGRNVWFEENECDQTGLESPQTDGPIVHWAKTDQTIRGNTITVTVGTANGRWGIIGYGSARQNKAANYLEDNVINGGGIHMANTNLMHVTGNTVNDWLILGTDVSCLVFEDNAINYGGVENYKFRRVTGEASGNTLNGEPFDLPMTNDEPFTNSPPHMW